MDCANRSSLFPANTLTILLQNHPCVFPGKLDYFFFCTLLRDHNVYFLLSSEGQPFLNHFSVFNIRLQHDFSWYKRCACIILFQKTGQNLRTCIPSGNPEIKVISADHPAASHKEHLHNCILFLKIQAFIHCRSYNISVFFSVGSNLLSLADLTNTLYQIPITGGILKTHFLGSCHHLVRKFVDRILKIPIQKTDHLLNVFPVLFLIHMPGAGTGTLFHMIVQTWPVLPAVTRKVSAA